MNGDHTYTNCTFNGPQSGSREERTMIAAMCMAQLTDVLKTGNDTKEDARIAVGAADALLAELAKDAKP